MGPPPDRLQTQMPRICTKPGTAALPTLGRFPLCQSVQSVSHRTSPIPTSDTHRTYMGEFTVDNFQTPGGAASLRRAPVI